jgi:hypothetical protein
MGKHRTEVTEVTEGDWDWWPKIFGERPEARGREPGEWGKHRTEGIRIGGEGSPVNIEARV